MSPELLDPESFGLEKSRLTKESDRYALGMVVYEVLSGRAPFAPSKNPVLKILRGEHPDRSQESRVTDGIWGMLQLCWNSQPGDRPSLDTVLQCLRDVTQPSGPHSGAGRDVETDTDEQSDVTSSDSGVFSLLSEVSGAPSIILTTQQFRRLHIVATDSRFHHRVFLGLGVRQQQSPVRFPNPNPIPGSFLTVLVVKQAHLLHIAKTDTRSRQTVILLV